MKKTIICAALFVSGICSLSFAELNLENDNKIIDIPLIETLSELELSEPKPLNPSLLNNNRFIALLGATLDDDNYYEFAQNRFAQRYHELYLRLVEKNDIFSDEEIRIIFNDVNPELDDSKKIKWHDLAFDNKPKYLACRYYLNADCIQQTLAQKQQIVESYTDNLKLIQRYIGIYTNYPNEIMIPYPDEFYMYSELPAYENFIKILDISLSKGLIDIAAGKIEHGIKYFIEQQTIINQMIKVDENNHKNLVNMMIAVAMQQILDQYLDALLNSEYRNELLMNSHLEKLFKLQGIYRDEITQSIIETNKFEQRLAMNALLNSVESAEKPTMKKELNRAYFELIVPYWEQAKIQLDIIMLGKMKTEYCEQLMNHFVKSLLCSTDHQLDYLLRGNTQLNYHNMVYLKYLIIKNNVQDENIPEFLKSQGDIAIDPITKEPFAWNAEKCTISLLLTEPKYLPVSVRQAVLENSDIQYLQVSIPCKNAR